MAMKEYTFSDCKDERFVEGKILFDSLLALGFQKYVSQLKIKPQVSIDKDSFRVPNLNAFFIVSHFLFAKLDQVKCEEQFRYCHPVLTNKEAQEFRRVCSRWLKEIILEKYGFLQKIPLPSILCVPGGPKFCHLYISFAQHVMKSTIQKISPRVFEELLSLPKSDTVYVDAASDVLKASTILYAQEIKRLESLVQEHSKTTSDYTKIIVEIYNRQKNSLEEYPTLIDHLEKQFLVSEETYDEAVFTKVLYLWEKLEPVFQNIDHQKEIAQMSLSNSNISTTINSQDYKVTLNKTFLVLHRKDMEQQHVSEIYCKKMLNLENLMKLAKITISSYHQQFKIFCNLIGDTNLQDLRKIHQNKCQQLILLNNKLGNEHIPDIEKSICNFDSRCHMDNQSVEAGPFVKSTPCLEMKYKRAENDIRLWTISDTADCSMRKSKIESSLFNLPNLMQSGMCKLEKDLNLSTDVITETSQEKPCLSNLERNTQIDIPSRLETKIPVYIKGNQKQICESATAECVEHRTRKNSSSRLPDSEKNQYSPKTPSQDFNGCLSISPEEFTPTEEREFTEMSPRPDFDPIRKLEFSSNSCLPYNEGPSGESNPWDESISFKDNVSLSISFQSKGLISDNPLFGQDESSGAGPVFVSEIKEDVKKNEHDPNVKRIADIVMGFVAHKEQL